IGPPVDFLSSKAIRSFNCRQCKRPCAYFRRSRRAPGGGTFKEPRPCSDHAASAFLNRTVAPAPHIPLAGLLMQELRLVFSHNAPGPFTVSFEDAPGHAVGVAVRFTPFLDDHDYEDLRWYLEDYLDLPDGGAVVRAQTVERKLDAWGRRLHDDVFAGAENAEL